MGDSSRRVKDRGAFVTMSSEAEVKTTEAIGPLPAGTSFDINYPEVTYTIFSI